MRAADRPVQRPEDARLMTVGPDGSRRHGPRSALADHLRPGDLVVANDAATLPASLHGVHRPTGADVEVRLAGRRTLDAADVRDFLAVVFGAGDHRTQTEDRPLPPPFAEGDVFELGTLRATVRRRLGHPRLVRLGFSGPADGVWAGLAAHGRPIQYAHMVEPLDLWDVWTRVASQPVAFEPPSAGFLLDWGLLDALRRRGIDFATLTHAAGLSSTGDPDLDRRLPFDEPYHLPASTVARIRAAQRRGGRVIALGTTVTRALEHASATPGGLRPGNGLADQTLGPGSKLRVVDAVVTGVHGPGESHYELLKAFTDGGTLDAADVAMERRGYRSHEFGDSVLWFRRPGSAKASPRAKGSPSPTLPRHQILDVDEVVVPVPGVEPDVDVEALGPEVRVHQLPLQLGAVQGA